MIRLKLITYIPANDDVEEDKYSETNEASFVDFVLNSGIRNISLGFNGVQVINSGGSKGVQRSHLGVFSVMEG